MDFPVYTKFWTGVILSGKNIVDEKALSVFDIDFEKLKRRGFELLIFDVDDTIDDFLGEIGQRSINLLKELQKEGFKVGIFSNSKPERTKYLEELFSKLGIYSVQRSDKPNPAGYLEIIKHYKLTPGKTAMVDDKVGTDMFGAYNAGIGHKILVEPFSRVFGGRKAKVPDRIIRKLEKFFYKK